MNMFMVIGAVIGCLFGCAFVLLRSYELEQQVEAINQRNGRVVAKVNYNWPITVIIIWFGSCVGGLIGWVLSLFF